MRVSCHAARTSGEPRVEPGVLLRIEHASGLQIVLDPELPDTGYQQLLTLDLSRFHQGPVRYDRARARWLSDLDEARRGT